MVGCPPENFLGDTPVVFYAGAGNLRVSLWRKQNNISVGGDEILYRPKQEVAVQELEVVFQQPAQALVLEEVAAAQGQAPPLL